MSYFLEINFDPSEAMTVVSRLQPRRSPNHKSTHCILISYQPFGQQFHSFWTHQSCHIALEEEKQFLGISISLLRLLSQNITNWMSQSNNIVLSHRVGGSRSKIMVSAGLVPFKGRDDESVPCLLVFLGLYMHHPDLCLHVHMTFSLCACLCTNLPFL